MQKSRNCTFDFKIHAKKKQKMEKKKAHLFEFFPFYIQKKHKIIFQKKMQKKLQEKAGGV